MKRLMCLLSALMLMLPCAAFAQSRWLIQDSDSRPLTEAELWQWDLESLGYILHEIYGRHGYHFTPGTAYEAYFTAQEWYTPHPRSNFAGCFAELSELEMQNIALIQSVQRQMMNQGSLNQEKGHSLWSNDPIASPLNFTLAAFGREQKLKVYSAPGSKSWRGASGKAAVSTNGDVWAAGWDGEWLLIYYETNKGSIRVGYVSGDSFWDDMSAYPPLTFAQSPAVVLEKCTLTDDPVLGAASITSLKKGAKVTYLTAYHLDESWAYIETKYNKKTVRGFVPLESIEINPE